MRQLVKKHQVHVRLSPQEAAHLERAAHLESKRRGEIVGAATLLRELAMPRVREIVRSVGEAA